MFNDDDGLGTFGSLLEMAVLAWVLVSLLVASIRMIFELASLIGAFVSISKRPAAHRPDAVEVWPND